MIANRLPEGGPAAPTATTIERSEPGRRGSAVAGRSMVDAVAVLRLAAGGGVRPRAAIGLVAETLPGSVGGEFGRAASEMAAGMALADAIDPSRLSLDPDLARLLRVLVAADTSGLDYSTELDALIDDIRRDRLMQLEVGIGRLSVAMQFPIVLCVLPAFALLAIAPLVVTTALQLGL